RRSASSDSRTCALPRATATTSSTVRPSPDSSTAFSDSRVTLPAAPVPWLSGSGAFTRGRLTAEPRRRRPATRPAGAVPVPTRTSSDRLRARMSHSTARRPVAARSLSTCYGRRNRERSRDVPAPGRPGSEPRARGPRPAGVVGARHSLFDHYPSLGQLGAEGLLVVGIAEDRKRGVPNVDEGRDCAYPARELDAALHCGAAARGTVRGDHDPLHVDSFRRRERPASQPRWHPRASGFRLRLSRGGRAARSPRPPLDARPRHTSERPSRPTGRGKAPARQSREAADFETWPRPASSQLTAMEEPARERRAGVPPLRTPRPRSALAGLEPPRPVAVPLPRRRLPGALVARPAEPVVHSSSTACCSTSRTPTLPSSLRSRAGARRGALVETDIADCFEAIPHDRLMQAIEEPIVNRQ